MEATSTILPPPSETSTMKTPSKNRSISDPPNINGIGTGTPNILAPSPTFHERIVKQTSKDDHDALPLPTTPRASRRPLSLQMPHMPSPSQFPPSSSRPAPLSPQLDRNNIYMHAASLQSSPATNLPRHSRGLDFSRACTNLHHSIRASESRGRSPDSSPVVMQKPLLIPGRARKGSVSSMVLDSPGLNGNGSMPPWGSTGGVERSAVSSSVGSVNMLASESESDDSEAAEDASMGGDDNEDPIFTTPQVHKLQNPNAVTPFVGAPSTPGGGGGANLWGTGSHFSPAQTSLMKTIRRSRLHKNGRKSRKSSSSASGSGYSSLNSPRNTSPPPLRSIESAANNGGYFNWPTAARSRRESLALGTDGLHLSSGNDSGDEASANNTPSTPGVVRRAVTRRGNLLPKTKGFARIRAALMEEAAPIDTDVRQEAETIRQVRERDGSLAGLDLTTSGKRAEPGADSPTFLPAVPEGAQEDLAKDFPSDDPNSAGSAKGLGMNFAAHASRNSGGMDYWNRYDASFRTPPPPPNFLARQSSSAMSDINMDSSSETQPSQPRPRLRARSSASDVQSETTNTQPQPSSSAGGGGGVGMMSDDMHLNRFKRRREENSDFDISTIKRRAVSPGMSANNSPVLTQSPTLKDLPPLNSGSGGGSGGNWGQPPERKSSQPVSASSETSTAGIGVLTGPPLSASSTATIALTPNRHGSAGSSMSLASGSTALGPSLTGGSGSVSGGGGTGSAPGSSGGPGGGGKKLGLQGMVDTNDGLMKMSIE